ncbi:hypothetical protein R3P38DRAFT_3184101 [Favolaschia claudopus]|uniref:Uncharacterized protein n=1 Tax=Favolaschia claudopus TaxID=2862362 RepID=A0AAW0CAI3_9AGAR
MGKTIPLFRIPSISRSPALPHPQPTPDIPVAKHRASSTIRTSSYATPEVPQSE